MKQTQGFGVILLIGVVAVVAVVVLIGGFLYVSNQNSSQTEAKMAAEKMQMEEKAMMEKKTLEEKAVMNKSGVTEPVGAMTDKDEVKMTNEEKAAMMKKDKIMEGDDSKVQKDDSAMMQKSGVYTAYSASAITTAEKGKTVLFFHAGWCPTCRTADADIVKNVATIPAGVTILKVDYDAEVALKQKYGVTTQHTFVEVDSKGAMLQKWSGGDLVGIVAKVK